MVTLTTAQRVLFSVLWGHHRLTCRNCFELMLRRAACRIVGHRLVIRMFDSGSNTWCTRCAFHAPVPS